MNAPVNIPPEMIFQALLENASHPIKRRNLQLIHTICGEWENGSRERVNLKEVGQELERRGGPKVKVLWNKQSIDYQKLVESWQTFVGKAQIRPSKGLSKEDDLLVHISDPAIRILVAQRLQNERRLQSEVNILKANANVSIDMRPLKDSQASRSVTSVGDLTIEVSQGPELSRLEREALEHAISSELWQDEGWIEAAHGRVVKDFGEGRTRTIFKPGFVDAIRKVLTLKEKRSR
jgi:hypothetical protein